MLNSISVDAAFTCKSSPLQTIRAIEFFVGPAADRNHTAQVSTVDTASLLWGAGSVDDALNNAVSGEALGSKQGNCNYDA